MEQSLEEIFSAEGHLSKVFKEYEERKEQKEMAKAIGKSFKERKVALFEAGTGTGKSLAYLAPSILHALAHGERVLISTHTIALQEQLLEKDIPILFDALGIEGEAVLVKGMQNYLCKQKMHEIEALSLFLTKEEVDAWSHLHDFERKTKEGTKSEITFGMPNSLWEKVRAEKERCTGKRCPHYKECYFYNARKKAEDAKILIVNHHLLCADILAYRDEREKSVIPPFDKLIIDEAHHLENTALSSLSEQVSRLSLIRLMNRLYADGKEEGLIFRLKKALSSKTLPYNKIAPLIAKLEMELPGQKKELIDLIDRAFTVFSEDVKAFYTESEEKIRFRADFFKSEQTEPSRKIMGALAERLGNFAAEMRVFASRLDELPTEEKKNFDLLATELLSSASILEREKALLIAFFSSEEKDDEVRYCEFNSFHKREEHTLILAKLDIGKHLQEHLFSRMQGSALLSATLSTDNSFAYIKERLGFEEKVDETIFASPFDFQRNVLFGVPTDLPEPNHPTFITQAADCILQAIHISGGGTFLLFTSYAMLESVYRLIAPKLKQYPLFKQGDFSRTKLIDKFRDSANGVLFGTDSFWEGVDVAGDALRLVVIAKLPFRVPSDPVAQAMNERVEKEGKSSFAALSLPQAAMKFKQGFGRLIRKKGDRGTVLCLDTRLVKKRYGTYFLSSLPQCKQSLCPTHELMGQLEDFFRLNRK